MRSGAISSASVSRVTRSSSSARSEFAVATPSSSMKLPRPVTTSRWMRTLCHSSRWRCFSTTVSTPSVASSEALSVAASSIAVSR